MDYRLLCQSIVVARVVRKRVQTINIDQRYKNLRHRGIEKTFSLPSLYSNQSIGLVLKSEATQNE